MGREIRKKDDAIIMSEKKTRMIEMFSNGYQSPEIAKELGVATRTVEVQMYNLRKELNYITTTQLVAEFIRKGLIK